jgi:hypothetical protein
MQCATIFERDGTYYLHSESRNTFGVWIAGPPYIKLDCNSSASALVDSVRHVLAASRIGIQDPPDVDEDLPSVAMAGARSWIDFLRGTRCVGMCRSDQGILEITSNRNGGKREGFVPLKPPMEIRADAIAEQVAAALAAAFAQCQ